MGLRWFRAFPRWVAWLALAALLAGQGSVRIVQAQQPAGAATEPAAAKQPEQPIDIPTIRSESRMVTTPVTVFDSGGQFVYDLQQDEFMVYDNGELQRIQQFGTELHPIALVVVVETNDTTSEMLDDIRPLGSMFSDMVVGKEGQAALITYSDHVDVLQGFTHNGDKFDSALRKLAGRGSGYHLDDALGRALGMLDNARREPGHQEDRRVVIVFSDGYNIGSQMNKSEIVKRALNSDITIYGLGFKPYKGLWSRPQREPGPDLTAMSMGYPSQPNTASTPFSQQQLFQTPVPVIPILLATGETVKSIVLKSSLEYFAYYSGGIYYAKWGKSTVQQTLNRVATEIHGQYELAYVPDNLKETGFHRIEVKVRRPGAKVRARAGYYYQATPTANSQ